MNIPVTRSSMPPFDEYVEKIKDLWDTRWLTNSGSMHQEFISKLKNYLSVNNIELFVNGHLALETALQVLNLSGEVITTPFTFASTTQSIVRCGLTPVFCDIKPDDYTIDPKKIESLITENTSAILPVHVYGNICDIDAIQKIADKYKLKVIYDAAHAFGISIDGHSIAEAGDISMFSFHATKVFHAIEGGALVYNDDCLSEKLKELRNFGISPNGSIAEIGGNAKMNEFQAAMGLCNLQYIDNEINKRGEIYQIYCDSLADIEGISLPVNHMDCTKNFAYFPIVINEKTFGRKRDEVFTYMATQGIVTRKYFYPLTSDFECYIDRFEIQPTPIASQIAQNVLTLPLYADLTENDAHYVIKCLLESRYINNTNN